MARTGILAGINEAFGVFRSAVAVSQAIESGRTPRSTDLKRLGVDPMSFNRINNR